MKLKLIAASLLIGHCFFAQQNSENEANVLKNTLKTNVTAYAFKNINLTYERSLSKNMSVSLGLSMMPKGDVPFFNSILKEQDRKDFGDVKVSNTAFTLEGRYYFGKKYNSGFYLAPYYRFTNFKVDELDYHYTIKINNTTTIDNPIDLTGKMSAHSFGLMVGSQWLLGSKENWVLDWWIAGGHYGFSSGDLSGKTKYVMGVEQQNQLQKELDDLDIPIVKHKATVNANGAIVKMDGPWAGLRSGLSIGYRF